jgi:tetracycline 7-halogenase / FADH2 O2-dependent halogenase
MTTPASDRVDADVAIVGSGFGGALTALLLRQLGRSVVLLERGRHPRFAIGESSTPLANLLIEELADRYGLPRVRAFSKWGTWRREHPDVACGLKRGFSFFRHEPGQPFTDGPDHARQLLVAASPHDEIADTHWYRPDFDAFLVREAESAGVTYLDETALGRPRFESQGAVLEGARHGRTLVVTARFVIDASGPRGYLQRSLGLAEAAMRFLPATEGLYTHFRDVARWDHLLPSDRIPPYPVDDAALHHVFPGGWIWVLRFANGITSAGAAVVSEKAGALRLSDGAAAWDRLLAELPSVGAQFAKARAVHPFVHAPRLAARTATVCGPRWAMLPSAAGVIDPLLSTGFPLNLLGIGRLVEALDQTWEREDQALALDQYAAATEAELDATERLVAALYASMDDFELFKRLTLLYFTAASFSETVRRLGRPEKARGFLLHADPRFGSELRSCCHEALGRPQGDARDRLIARIDRAIAPLDVAGLGDRSRRDWYPVRAADLLDAAAKLDARPDELRALLQRCGFAADATSPRPAALTR